MKSSFYLALFKRELLQHNRALWLCPLLLLCLMQVAALYSVFLILTEVGPETTITLNQEAYKVGKDLESLMNNQTIPFQPLYGFVIFALAVCLFYLLDSLYSDRKDRSVLFWRSLPFSEHENVLIKLLTAMLVIPGVFMITGMVSLALAGLILYSGISMSGIELEQSGRFIAYISGLGTALELFLSVFFFSVFMAPIHLALLTVSAFAKRSPWLTVILPLLAISIVELMLFREIKFLRFLSEYTAAAAKLSRALVGDGVIAVGAWQALGVVAVSVFLYFGCVFLRQRKFEI